MKYKSVQEWMEAEHVPSNFFTMEDEELSSRFVREYRELRCRLYANHVETLTIADQRKIEAGQHPSQSHAFAKDAEPYCERLRRHLKSIDAEPLDVSLGWYHFDRIVLSVDYDDSMEVEKLESLPWLFQGFEVMYLIRSE